MPIVYSRDDHTRQITVVNSGAVTLADLLGILDRQAAEGTWAYRMLYDAQNAVFTPSQDDVRTLANRARELSERCGPRGVVAVVTPQSAAFEAGTLYSALSSDADIRVRVFLNRSSAQRWLTDMPRADRLAAHPAVRVRTDFNADGTGRRAPSRPRQGDLKNCPDCHGVMQFDERSRTEQGRLITSDPKWVCLNPPCRRVELVRDRKANG